MRPNLAAKPEVFATSFISPEGPVFNREGVLFICDFGVYPPTDDPEEDKDRNVYRVGPQGEVEVFVNTRGMPTGSAFHRDGRLFLCDSGREEILSISTDGQINVLASEYKGASLMGPNDLAFDMQGNLYFTDPKGSSLENDIGGIYLYSSTGELERVDTGYAFPNGIALGPNERELYVAETHTQRIYMFTIESDGKLSGKSLFSTLPQDPLHPEYGPDGMAFDIRGNLYVAHWGRGCIDILNRHGELIGELPCLGKRPTNLAFWDSAIYVTEMEKGQVVRLDIAVPGLKLFNMLE